MRAPMMCGSVLLLTFMLSTIRSNVLEDIAPNSDRLVLERRDEELQYPDDIYDSGEQDRWPTLEELAMYSNKRQQSRKRGRIQSPYTGEENHGESEGKMVYGKHPLAIKRRQGLENSLYDLLSSKPRPAPERRTMDNLQDLFAVDLLKRHRIPRSPDNTSLQSETNEDQHISKQLVQNKSSDELVTE